MCYNGRNYFVCVLKETIMFVYECNSLIVILNCVTTDHIISMKCYNTYINFRIRHVYFVLRNKGECQF